MVARNRAKGGRNMKNDETIESSIVQARPGWFVIEPVYDENKKVVETSRSEILAWKIISHGVGDEFPDVVPITIESYSTPAMFLSPEDRYFIAEIESFENETEVINYFKSKNKHETP